MTLTSDDRKAIIEYRIERAHQTIEEIDYAAKGKYWNLVANRLYYAIFYICEALLLKNQIITNSHAGLIRMVNLHFIRTKLVSENEGDLLKQLFRMRLTGDYDDLTDWTEKDIMPLIPATKELIKHIEDLIYK